VGKVGIRNTPHQSQLKLRQLPPRGKPRECDSADCRVLILSILLSPWGESVKQLCCLTNEGLPLLFLGCVKLLLSIFYPSSVNLSVDSFPRGGSRENEGKPRGERGIALMVGSRERGGKDEPTLSAIKLRTFPPLIRGRMKGGNEKKEC